MERRKRIINRKLTVLIVGAVLVVGGIVAIIASVSKKSADSDVIGSWRWEKGVFTYEFEKNGTGKYSLGEAGEQKFSYRQAENKVLIKYDGTENELELEYRIEDNKLIIKDSFGNDIIYNKQ